MTTHELARMMTHLRDAFGPNLRSDAVKGMSEAADAFQAMPEKPLGELVKDLQKANSGVDAIVQQILAAKQGSGSKDAVLAAVQKLRQAELKAVLGALHLPTKGKVGEQKAAIAAFIAGGTAPAPEANGHHEAIESAYRLYESLSNSDLGIEELRTRFAPLRDAEKPVLVGVAQKLGYQTDDSRADIAKWLLQNLEGICTSRVKNELIDAAS